MNVIKHGEDLLNTGSLTWRRNIRKYQDSLHLNYVMEWPATSNVFETISSQENIMLVSSNKSNYKSPLHFAWRVIFFLREFDSKKEIIETISETQFNKINFNEASLKIKSIAQHWYVLYQHLLPSESEAYYIWNDGLDIYILFEDKDSYIGWNWSSTA